MNAAGEGAKRADWIPETSGWCSPLPLGLGVQSGPGSAAPTLLSRCRPFHSWTRQRSTSGPPYRLGGASPSGFDCSGFVRFVFHAFGVQLNRSSGTQATQGDEARRAGEIQPGDLLFFRIRLEAGSATWGFSSGEGQFIHASSRGGPGVRGVKIARLDSSFYAKRLVSARRVMTARGGTDGTPASEPVKAARGRIPCARPERSNEARLGSGGPPGNIPFRGRRGVYWEMSCAR